MFKNTNNGQKFKVWSKNYFFRDVPGAVVIGDSKEDCNLEKNSVSEENVTNNNNSPTQENNIFYSLPEPPPYKR